MDGVVNVRKPAGPTSHDIVDEVRRIFGQKRVGHAGTLDPMATGVLVVCIGKATRIVEYLMGATKKYRARMVFGVSTDSQDSTGAVDQERDASSITREMAEEAAKSFVGDIEQIPPMVSALKHEGQPLYKLARQGKTIERAPRKVIVHSIEVTDFDAGSRPEAEIVVRCSSGTYIRTICSDIGDRLGCGAHMSMLERESVGRFALEDSVTMDQLREAREQDRLADFVIGIDEALSDLPSATLAAEHVAHARHGLAVPVAVLQGEGDAYRVLSPDGGLIALGSISSCDGAIVAKPRKVMNTGEE